MLVYSKHFWTNKEKDTFWKSILRLLKAAKNVRKSCRLLPRICWPSVGTDSNSHTTLNCSPRWKCESTSLHKPPNSSATSQFSENLPVKEFRVPFIVPISKFTFPISVTVGIASSTDTPKHPTITHFLTLHTAVFVYLWLNFLGTETFYLHSIPNIYLRPLCRVRIW